MKLAQWWSWEVTVKTNSETKAKPFCSTGGLGLSSSVRVKEGLSSEMVLCW